MFFFFFNTTALSFNFLFITVYKACPESVSCKSAFFFFPFSNAERKDKNTYQVIYHTYLDHLLVIFVSEVYPS